METVKKNDFVELEFTGTANGQVFDTTDTEEAKKMGLENPDVKPLIVSIGEHMLLKGFDESLEGKEIGKEYTIHLTPEQAFGKRNPSLIKTYSIKSFQEKNINLVPGMALQLDNNIVKIISVSGGRVMVDFNNPLAGKEVNYEFTIKRKVKDDEEKINAFQDFFFKQRFNFEIKKDEKNKIKVIFKDSKIKPIIEMFKQKFKDISGVDVEVVTDEKRETENRKEKSDKIKVKKTKNKEEQINPTTEKQQ